jgi:DNA (cytosine-5)-methyltransferase 1
MENKLILSVFPGIDMLGMGFEQQKFCIVRGPDLITGGDIREFFPPKGVFGGLIGGPPCQDFSQLNRNPGTYSLEMLEEYQRVVKESDVDWFLFENVAQAPSFTIDGYKQQRFALDLGWFSEFSRLRHFIFGSKSGVLLDPMVSSNSKVSGTAVTGSDSRSFRACCDIQGLPQDFDLPSFTLGGKKQAVANGVPLFMGHYIAGLIAKTIYGEGVTPNFAPKNDARRCNCGCGRVVAGRSKTSSPACRKRVSIAKIKANETNGEDNA